jgi:hypothetical protein
MADGPGVLRLGHEAFAAGLFWQPAPTAATAAREARIVASQAELGADLFCVRRRGVPQFGLAQVSQGHRPGMRALAAAVADCRPEASWVGVFPVPDRWLYLAVRNGAIMPDGDLLFDREEAARDHLGQDLEPGEWKAVFAPSSWGIADSRPLDLVETISPLADARLRRVASRWLWPLLWTALAAVAAAVVVCSLSAGPAEKSSQVPVAPAPPPPPPWQTQPPPVAVIAFCAKAIEEAPVVPGFELETASCAASGGTATYHRQGGTMAWAPNLAQVTAPDRLVLPLVLTAQPPADGAAPAAFKVMTLSLGGRLPPDVLSAMVVDIPAFVVEEVAWHPPGWRVKGKAYVR